MATVIGVFDARDQAEKAINEMRNKGFDKNEISIVAKDQRGTGEGGRGEGGLTMMAEDDLADGTVTGGAIGGAAGLLAGIGALAIPGIGPIVAAGPIAAALTGAVTGGLVGGLVDMGIPEQRSEFYENQVKQGRILTVIKADQKKVDDAARILRQNGATDVEVH
ncbi:MAG TPA: hypothetical protein GXX51_06725 [Firmicutes bacterium]|nr:hypothetical protein [Bacillota bacterium]